MILIMLYPILNHWLIPILVLPMTQKEFYNGISTFMGNDSSVFNFRVYEKNIDIFYNCILMNMKSIRYLISYIYAIENTHLIKTVAKGDFRKFS